MRMSEKTRNIGPEELQQSLELLGAFAEPPRLLGELGADERARFKQAASRIAHPDRTLRRRQRKEELREHKANRVRKIGGSLHETGIPSLRRKPVFTTPNYFLPESAAHPAADLPPD